MIKNFKKALEKTLRYYNALYKSGNWYVKKEKIIIVVNLQKSNYGNVFFLNFGIFIKGMQSIDFPKEQFCHIRLRLSEILPSDNDMLQEMLAEKLNPFLNRLNNIEDVKEMYEEGFFKKAFIHKDIKGLLNG